jgi:hypothetical protein
MATISVGDLTPRNQYTATSSQTVFAYSFPIFADADLKVYQGSTLLTLTTHYTVSGAATDNGGNVTLVTGATLNDIITICRDLPVARTSDFQANGDLLAETLNDDLDKIVMMAQQNESGLVRKIGLQLQDEDATMELPVKATRSTKMLGFDSDGDVTVSNSTVTEIDGAVDILSSSTTGLTNVVSIATLKLLGSAVDDNDSITVLGYSNEGDGGSGTFFWDASSTATDNGGTIIQATGVVTGRWIRVHESSINVKWFGATGDGSTDDTTSIQAAIDAVETDGGGAVYIPAGTYKTTSALEISQRYVSIYGEGGSASIISALSCNALNFVSASYDNGACFIRDIGLIGHTGSTANWAAVQSVIPAGGVVSVDSRDGLHFEGVYISNFNQGFILGSTWEWTVEKCKFRKVNNCFFLGNYTMVGRIANNFMVYESGDDYSGTYDKWCIHLAGAVNEGIVIEGNQIYGFERGVWLQMAIYVNILNNDIYATEYGIHVQTASNGLNIKHNYIQVAGDNAIGVYGPGLGSEIQSHINCEGNHFITSSGADIIGIQLNIVSNQNQWHWRIAGNFFQQLTGYDIVIYNGGDVVIENNRCDSSATTHSLKVYETLTNHPIYINNNTFRQGFSYSTSDYDNGDIIIGNNVVSDVQEFGSVWAKHLSLVDGITAPGAGDGARIYVDTADGDLKVIFPDGIIKTIAADT